MRNVLYSPHCPLYFILPSVLTVKKNLTRKGPTSLCITHIKQGNIEKLVTNIFWLFLTYFQIFKRNKMVFLYILVSCNIAGYLDKYAEILME